MRPTRLPAAPLLEAVGRHPAIGVPRRGWTERLKHYAGKPGLRAYERARRDGWLTPQGIEQLCDRFGLASTRVVRRCLRHRRVPRSPGHLRPLAEELTEVSAVPTPVVDLTRTGGANEHDG